MTGRSEPTPPSAGQSPNVPYKSTTQNCLQKSLKGEILEVKWQSGIKVSRSKSTVPEPHWKIGLAVEDGAGSKRPGVYLVAGKGSDKLTLKVKITQNENVTGTGTVSGQLGALRIEGTCPTAVGEHTVNATITNLPDYILHDQASVSWDFDSADLGASIVLSNRTRLEVFVVLATPSFFYTPGVWVEALRFVCDKVSAAGLKTPEAVAATITAYCHTSHGLIYDTGGGRPAYGVSGSGGTFQLDPYIKAVKLIVNCYDQAAAIQSLSGAVGVKLDWHYLEPFGYINTTDLIGIGACNSPFFTTNGSTAVVPVLDPKRTAFGNHAFGGLGGKILDACAGPHRGTEDKAQYCTASIDSTAALYGGGFRPGTAADIQLKGGVSNVV